MVNVLTGDCRARTRPARPAMNEAVRLPLHFLPLVDSVHSARRYHDAATMAAASTRSANGLNSHRVRALWNVNATRFIPFISGTGPGYRSRQRPPIRGLSADARSRRPG